MARREPLPFDPIEEAARQWSTRWDAVDGMRAVTSLMRAQQLVLSELDEKLREHGLTFARYEALVLLTFSRRGSLPLGKMGERLQVHPTSVTSIVHRLEAAGLVTRLNHPTDRRTVLAEITDLGRERVAVATKALVEADFGLGSLGSTELEAIFDVLRPVRLAAGDFTERPLSTTEPAVAPESGHPASRNRVSRVFDEIGEVGSGGVL